MRHVVFFLFVAWFVPFPAIPQNNPAVSSLTSTLMTLNDAQASRDSVNRQFATRLMGYADRSSQLSQTEVTEFTAELTDALVGHTFTNLQITEAVSAMVEVVRSSGVGFAAFHGALDRFAKALAQLGVSPARAGALATRLEAIGNHVRGPEDLRIYGKLK